MGNRVPIIAPTTGTVKGEKERCSEVGMDGYLSKPIAGILLLMVLDFWQAKKV